MVHSLRFHWLTSSHARNAGFIHVTKTTRVNARIFPFDRCFRKIFHLWTSKTFTICTRYMEFNGRDVCPPVCARKRRSWFSVRTFTKRLFLDFQLQGNIMDTELNTGFIALWVPGKQLWSFSFKAPHISFVCVCVCVCVCVLTVNECPCVYLWIVLGSKHIAQ